MTDVQKTAQPPTQAVWLVNGEIETIRVIAIELLLFVFSSAFVDWIRARLVTDPLAGALGLTRAWKVIVPPFLMVIEPRLQVMVLPLREPLPRLFVFGDSWGGSTSVSVTPVAVMAPWFV